MEIKILFDRETINKSLYRGWGVSFLIDERILFDTGENGRWLLKNIKNLKVDIDKIIAVIISHDHWDHTGGLWKLLEKREELKVYACPNFSLNFKKKVGRLRGKLIETEKVTEISERIFVTGEIAGEYKGKYMPEQALIVRTEKGLTIITGCSHPGIIKIVEKVKKDFPDMKIHLVFGGFHLINKSDQEVRLIAEKLKEMGIERVGPTHCSGYDAEMIFKEIYKDNFVFIKTGQILEI